MSLPTPPIAIPTYLDSKPAVSAFTAAKVGHVVSAHAIPRTIGGLETIYPSGGDEGHYHHKRYDGLGYPEGLKEEKIPLGARIIAICDSINVVTSSRVYRKEHSFEYCYYEIEKNLGKMYDPNIGKFVLDHWQKVTGI